MPYPLQKAVQDWALSACVPRWERRPRVIRSGGTASRLVTTWQPAGFPALPDPLDRGEDRAHRDGDDGEYRRELPRQLDHLAHPEVQREQRSRAEHRDHGAPRPAWWSWTHTSAAVSRFRANAGTPFGAWTARVRARVSRKSSRLTRQPPRPDAAPSTCAAPSGSRYGHRPQPERRPEARQPIPPGPVGGGGAGAGRTPAPGPRRRRSVHRPRRPRAADRPGGTAASSAGGVSPVGGVRRMRGRHRRRLRGSGAERQRRQAVLRTRGLQMRGSSGA